MIQANLAGGIGGVVEFGDPAVIAAARFGGEEGPVSRYDVELLDKTLPEILGHIGLSGPVDIAIAIVDHDITDRDEAAGGLEIGQPFGGHDPGEVLDNDIPDRRNDIGIIVVDQLVRFQDHLIGGRASGQSEGSPRQAQRDKAQPRPSKAKAKQPAQDGVGSHPSSSRNKTETLTSTASSTGAHAAMVGDTIPPRPRSLETTKIR